MANDFAGWRSSLSSLKSGLKVRQSQLGGTVNSQFELTVNSSSKEKPTVMRPLTVAPLFLFDQASVPFGAASHGQCRPDRGLVSCPVPQRAPHVVDIPIPAAAVAATPVEVQIENREQQTPNVRHDPTITPPALPSKSPRIASHGIAAGPWVFPLLPPGRPMARTRCRGYSLEPAPHPPR